MEIDDHANPWLTTAWELSGDNALEAVKIVRELPPHLIMLMYGMKVYSNSFVADLDD